MSDPFLAEIRMFGFNFAPRGWARCDGQVLPLSQNVALFSLLGTQYGGNGVSNFALPDLRNSFAIGAGQGPGLSPYAVGESGGESSHSLLASEMPAHSHDLRAGASGLSSSPTGAALAPPVNGAAAYRMPGTKALMSASSIGSSGGGQPHENRQPYLGLTFCIAMTGIFPPRN